MFLPYRNQNPPETFPFATVCLIVANVVLYFATSVNGLVIKEDIALNFGTSLANFHWYQLISSMFLHGGPFHLIGNMWFLYLFGFAVEGRLKAPKFLILYFLAGFAGDALHLLLVGQMAPKVPMIGASGAIMGVMGAAMYMFPHATVDVAWTFWWRFGTSEWKLWWVGLYYVAFDILEAVITTTAKVSGGVANLAHLGGVATGFLLPAIMRVKRDDEQMADAKSTLYMTNDITLLSERELRDLHRVNPTRPDITLQWLNKSIFSSHSTSRDEAVKAFHQMFPRIIVSEPIALVCQAVNGLLLSDPNALTPAQMGRVASRAEKEGQFAPALQLYRTIANDPRATSTDIEGASFRVAMLLESAFQDYGQAKEWYDYIKTTFPMSPVITQVNQRLQFLTTKSV